MISLSLSYYVSYLFSSVSPNIHYWSYNQHLNIFIPIIVQKQTLFLPICLAYYCSSPFHTPGLFSIIPSCIPYLYILSTHSHPHFLSSRSSSTICQCNSYPFLLFFSSYTHYQLLLYPNHPIISHFGIYIFTTPILRYLY